MDYLSATGRYIYVTPEFKVINPTHDAQIFKYSGEISGYDFKNQKKNLLIIQNILEKMQMQLVYVYVGKFIGDTKIKTSFIAHSENRRVWWRKYEGKGDNDGGNFIYMDGRCYKLSKWIKENALL